MLVMCDLYVLGLEAECPGIAAHCARDEHCYFTDEVCAADRKHDDHPTRCCSCGAL